jgi:hypothetical protein
MAWLPFPIGWRRGNRHANDATLFLARTFPRIRLWLLQFSRVVPIWTT